MRKEEQDNNAAPAKITVKLIVRNQLTWTDWFGSQGQDLTEEVVAPQGCYITQWKLGIKRLHAYCGHEAFTIPVIVSIQGMCNNGLWLKKLQSSSSAEEYRMMPEKEDGYFKLTGQSGGWLTGMLDCRNDRDDHWQATAKTEQGEDCKVVGYQMRLDGGCAGARFGFDHPVAERQSYKAAVAEDISQQNAEGLLEWTDWFGNQGSRLTEKVVAPQGCYITQWKLGIKHLHAYCGAEEFDIPVIVSIQGKCNSGQWLTKITSPATAVQYNITAEQAEGYLQLTGQSGGWLTGMLNCGNDRDDHWEATATHHQGEDRKVVGYQMRLDGECAGARFAFGSSSRQVQLDRDSAYLQPVR